MSTGAKIIAQTLKKLGVTVVFGIVGIPIVEVGEAFITEGIRFISFRNEQSAAYAASAYGYLTGKPGVLLVVGGPGVIHALSGIFNSNANRWPLLVLAGSAGFNEIHKGAFQELDQISFLTPHVKFAARPLSIEQIPSFIFKAYKTSFFGTPGSTYIDISADLVEDEITVESATDALASIRSVTVADVPRFLPPPSKIQLVAQLIKSAKNPLVIIGKGAAYSNAHQELRQLVNNHNLPFLPTPMAKGVVQDSNPLNVSSARSQALINSDVIVLFGARINWILHFGEAPRFQRNVKFVQVDTHAEEIGNNSPEAIEHSVVGDIALVAFALHSQLGSFKSPGVPQLMKETIRKNNSKLIAKENLIEEQLNYNNVYKTLRQIMEPIEKDTILVTEGANTMDIARISFNHEYPKSKLDCGTNATMGVGLGYAIAAKIAEPEKYVIAIEGDSAFGFSGLELETAVRSKLPIIVILMNNSGVYHGTDDNLYEDATKLPTTALSKETRYDVLARSLGCDGTLVRDQVELSRAFKTALQNYKFGVSSLINVIISPGKIRKVGFGWQNKKKPSSKL
ncbi:hypothetical protein WICPIJ_001594 [Wickerhamomyces pijperi]|uniref:2-hydroxyacyl-CoA lyase n=1 Tax=Wickerhamomyces pijperi TaxID=599730 RepID=A0A9P8QD80_WICPI|nr:hypothetical protein WICPIJ_001594 [Wickerhamomyces pijperi]